MKENSDNFNLKGQFPLQIQSPVFIYFDEEACWKEYNSFAFKIPNILNPIHELFHWKFLEITCEEIDLLDRESLFSIQVRHDSDFHYTNQYEFKELRLNIDYPDNFDIRKYKYLFFKRDKDIQYAVAFDKEEKINNLILELFFLSKYSEISIQAQVVDTLSIIFYVVLKKILQMVGLLQNIEYKSMFDLTNQLIRDQINIELNQMDVYSIVYKSFLTIGLFPIHCELNTMNDSQIVVFLQNLILGSDVAPWSTKFHGSMGFGNIRYSLTNSSIVHLRTMVPRKQLRHTYQYLSLRIIDFFPLDQWIESVGKFFVENLQEIWKNIKTQFPNLKKKKQNQRDSKIDGQSDMDSSSCSDIKEPLLIETELMQQSLKNTIEKQWSNNLKDLLKESLAKIEITKEYFGIEKKESKMRNISEQIAYEFHQNYSNELHRNNNLFNLSQIIVETERKGYSYFTNNCQTPLAAMIYALSDTFRPFSEVLYDKTRFYYQQNDRKVENINLRNEDLKIYCKFASIIELAMLSRQLIRPALLKHSLDYFGFYSDKLTQEYLNLIRETRFDPDNFDEKSHKHLHSDSKTRHDPTAQVNKFQESFNISRNQGIYQYYNIKMKKLSDPLLVIEEFKLCQESQLDLDSELDKFQMHYLLIHFTNEILRLKKTGIKDAMQKHKYEGYMDTIFFFYFNSIRLQVERQQRENVLSQFGFVLVKSLSKVQTGEPSNIAMQKTQ